MRVEHRENRKERILRRAPDLECSKSRGLPKMYRFEEPRGVCLSSVCDCKCACPSLYNTKTQPDVQERVLIRSFVTDGVKG